MATKRATRPAPPPPDDTTPHPADEVTLPHSIDAERNVLGALIIDNQALDAIGALLTGPEFYREAHRRIFKAMVALGERRVAVDFTTLKEELLRAGDLGDCGGPSYVAGLTDGVPRSTNVTHYAAIVREKHRLRATIDAGNRMVKAAYAAEESADAIVAAADKAVLALHQQRPAGHVRVVDLVQSLFKRIEWRHEHRGEVTGVPTGFKSVDNQTFGWQPGDMNVLAAGTSMGKTTFTLNCAMAASEAGKRVVYFSLEMRKAALMDRLLSVASGVELTRIQGGFLGSQDYAKISAGMERLDRLTLLIDDRSGLTPRDVRGACRRIKAEGGLDLVVIDYVQLMPGDLGSRNAGNRYAEVSDHSLRIKNDIAGDLEVPVIVLSQLNRNAVGRTDPRPQLGDLRESGRLEEDADAVMFLWRPDRLQSGTTELIFAKQRQGSAGTLNLTFDRDTQTFIDGGAPIPEAPRSGSKRYQGRPSERRRGYPSPGDDLPMDEAAGSDTE